MTEIQLIVRGDDIGCSHATNLACIEAYQKGIMTSVEVMVPCNWFPEAAKLLNENPELDVGVHTVLTSEWENIKWRPITNGKSFVDKDGYFLPMVWPREYYGENKTLYHSRWNPKEIESELRAQIELALSKIPHITHLSTHMEWPSRNPELKEIYTRLAREYHLSSPELDIFHFEGFQGKNTLDERVDLFINWLKGLKTGTWIFVEHPSYDVLETKAMWHIGYENVAQDRDLVTKLLIDQRVKNAIKNLGIKLINYRDL